MPVFWAQSKIEKVDGKEIARLSLGSDYNRARFADFLKANVGIRLKIQPQTPETRNQRKFFEGAVVPFITFYQEGMDYRSPEDQERVREWLKIEFNSQFVTLKGRSHKVPKTTVGHLKEFLERVIDWADSQGYDVSILNPDEYKRWRDEVRPFGGPEDYITYLVELKRIQKQP